MTKLTEAQAEAIFESEERQRRQREACLHEGVESGTCVYCGMRFDISHLLNNRKGTWIWSAQ